MASITKASNADASNETRAYFPLIHALACVVIGVVIVAYASVRNQRRLKQKLDVLRRPTVPICNDEKTDGVRHRVAKLATGPKNVGKNTTAAIKPKPSAVEVCTPEFTGVLVNGRRYRTGRYYDGGFKDESYLISTTPRPIAEPPIFDYEWLTMKNGVLDLEEQMHDIVYGKEPTFKRERTDLMLEARLLKEFAGCTWEMQRALSSHGGLSNAENAHRWSHLRGLEDALEIDRIDVLREQHELERTKMTKRDIREVKKAESLGIPVSDVRDVRMRKEREAIEEEQDKAEKRRNKACNPFERRRYRPVHHHSQPAQYYFGKD